MRHRTILSLALILGLAAALNTTPLLAMQDEQQAEEEGCESVRTVTVGEETFEFKLDCTSNFAEGLEIEAEPEGGSAEAGGSPEAGGSAEADQLFAVRFIGESGTVEAANS